MNLWVAVAVALVLSLGYRAIRYRMIRARGQEVWWSVPIERWWSRLRGRPPV